ncbi:gluconolactone oxidase [Aspergillus steynii IBT 23096]|uniref:Gluconolactone oxidase n=1 Tax=Aspergillus steynii IBT 23096 TaxID=1392250 RepID=A0A2I2G780_9EURO|nr:gluconolactone oxidase [Aspergillus steynii IBT 23096]PLB48718.1 gluconolactone oxidase [Aspergillus steynii IBT 23096]
MTVSSSMSYFGTALLSLLALNNSLAGAYRWFNWQFDVTCEATGLFVPSDESDLIDFVKDHYPRRTMIKPVGNGHGFGNLTTCVSDGETKRDSYIVSLTNLKELHVHKNNNTVTFGGGWDLIDLIPTLHHHGLQVSNLGSEMVQNYIGAATTGTHGTEKQKQNIASQILGLSVLDATGKMHVIDKEQTPDLLNAYTIAIGALGVITKVTIQAEPVSYLKRTSKVVERPSNITQLYQTIAGFAEKYEQVNILGPHLDWDPATKEPVPRTNITLVYWVETNFSGVQNCSTDFCANDCARCDRSYFCYDYKMNAIATPPTGICYRGFMGQFEHFFPMENLAAAGTDYFNYARAQGSRLEPYLTGNTLTDGVKGYESDDVTVITRFVKGDKHWLSPVNTDNLAHNASGIFATLGYSWLPTYNNFTTQWFFQDLRASTFRSSARSTISTYASTIYTKVDDWLEIQKKNYPHCQFLNELLIDALGIDRCKTLFN